MDELIEEGVTRLPPLSPPYTCPICNDMDPLCLLVSCEERLVVLERRRRLTGLVIDRRGHCVECPACLESHPYPIHCPRHV